MQATAQGPVGRCRPKKDKKASAVGGFHQLDLRDGQTFGSGEHEWDLVTDGIDGGRWVSGEARGRQRDFGWDEP